MKSLLNNNKWSRIIIYYSIALISSFLFRYGLLKNPLGSGEFAGYIIGLLGAIGPFLGGLAMRYFQNPTAPKMSFTGLLTNKSFVLILVPALLFGIFGTTNDNALNSHLIGFLLGAYIAVYGILEETGWRGYLQEEFKELKPMLQYFIVALFWYAWHLTFLGETNLMNECVIFLILWASSIGIGIVAKKTQSIIIAACFHIIGNILAFSTEMSSSFSIKQE